jgi:ABC-type transport system involved in multi-copper enzyme maturation permease subunit
MSVDTALLNPSHSRGWAMGLGNMLSKEFGSWWKTRRWWLQCLVAVLLQNGSLALNMRGGMAQGAAMNFLATSALLVPLAAISLAQDTILGERHSGTAAWVFTKPLQRPAYILAKVLAHGLGLLVAWVLIPVSIAFVQLGAVPGTLTQVSGFVGAMGLIFLNLFFYMALAMMLATIFNGRGPVLGICVFLSFVGPIGLLAAPIEKYMPWLTNIMPWTLTFPAGNVNPLVMYVVNGQPLPTIVPIVASVLWCVAFIAVAIWRTSREEF